VTQTFDQARPSSAGTTMWTEIAEQPEVWRRGLAERRRIEPVTAAVRRAAPRFVLFAARGTSDHAALYAKYLFEVVHQMPAGLISPSTVTAYGARPDLRDVLVVAVSQSGRSPDLVQTVEASRRHGALTLAVTNDALSPLAQAAELHIDILAGPEQAVAATKSYTAQLLSLYLLVDQLRGGDGEAATALPEAGDRLLALEGDVRRSAEQHRGTARFLVTGRGYSSATAHEAALKLMETSYLPAQAFSGADLLHGPIAMVDSETKVLLVAPDGAGGSAMREAITRLRDLGAETLCVGGTEAVAGSSGGIVLPPGLSEEVSPIAEIVPFQHFALHLALAHGNNPDSPRGLSKVTETR
jgi:glucosamine--fructose-6-phosphate aminotransferase (isomerizing)